MSATTITLLLVRETEKARLYRKKSRAVTPIDEEEVWIPKSIIEHTTKRGSEHDVKLPDWFVEKENL